MLKLHGSAISPNYNKVKLALLEKGIEFEEIPQRPSQDESYLVNSPMGKIPCMEVDGKFFAESTAMLEYLEDAYPTAPLLPKDAFERAKCRDGTEQPRRSVVHRGRDGAGRQDPGRGL